MGYVEENFEVDSPEVWQRDKDRLSSNMKGTWQGQESICRPVSLKSNLLLFAHWPADRLLALPGPFHVSQKQLFSYYDTLKNVDFKYNFVV